MSATKPNLSAASSPELFDLLEALCEDRIAPNQTKRLEQLVLGDATARRVYLTYLDLHGTLHWDSAIGARHDEDSKSVTESQPNATTRNTFQVPRFALAGRGLWLVAASVTLVAALSFALGRWMPPQPTNPPIASNETRPLPEDPTTHEPLLPPSDLKHPEVPAADHPAALANSKSALQSIDAVGSSGDVPAASSEGNAQQTAVIANSPPRALPTTVNAKTNASGSVRGVVAVINEHLAAGWKLQGVEPSPQADDSEWLRRVYLDVVGHIPPLEVVEKFLDDRNQSKREKLVDRLLDDPGYYRNWSIVWTNLLIGRTDSRDVNRAALQKFLRESFARNRPWDQLVAELVSAEGRSEESGATNFLLAHLNNDAMPATAITSRVFLGRQIACTQCHDHPFNNWKQEEFWSYHSFFEQTAVARTDAPDQQTGKMRSGAALQTKHVGGPTHFETRRGLAQVAYPRFEGVVINDDADTNRRHELAKLMTSGEKPLVAEALVNRMWDHFFGFAFTRPVDDMGPHNPPSHPELLDHLAREFVASGYDLKQLVRWICLSDAYQRTSRFGKQNDQDDPASGTTPLFSRVYLKSMTVEQLYDSLLLATGADKTPLESGDHDRRRHEWLQQFVRAFQTDENDESLTFESTMTQALLMMNSELTQQALSLDRGSLLEKLARAHESDSEKLRHLCLATLTRLPTAKEQQAFRKLVANGNSARPNSAGWQDALWAYLNSSEFVLVH